MALAGIRVFILAENRLLREALTRLLNKKTDIEVVGASGTGSGVLSTLSECSPEVLLCDCPGVSPPEMKMLSQLREAVPGVRVILVGMDANKETFLRAVREGAVGYVLKEASASEIAASVRTCANGEAVCPPSLAMALFEAVSAQRTEVHTQAISLRYDLGLTRREQQLLQIISMGATNKEIAHQLNLSEQTVKNHIHRMLRKLGATNRLSAVALCSAPVAVA